MKKIDVINYFGTMTNVQIALSLRSTGTVTQWSEIIPEKQALRLEKITGGDLVYEPKFYEVKK